MKIASALAFMAFAAGNYAMPTLISAPNPGRAHSTCLATRRKRLHRLRAAFGGRVPKVRRIGVRGPGR